MSNLSTTFQTTQSPPVVISRGEQPKPLRVVRVRDWRELERRIGAWKQLLGRSLWPNPCYSPSFLLPLLKHQHSEQAEILLVESAEDASEPTLLGLAPIIRSSIYRLPFKTATIWRPDFTFDGTPLLDKVQAASALDTLLNSLRHEGYRLLCFDTTSAEDGFAKLVESRLRDDNLPRFTRTKYQRAALRPTGTFEAYCREKLSKNRRKKIRRQVERLSKQGQLNFERSANGDDLAPWVSDFRKLEASGWKGEQKSAILSDDRSVTFFDDLVGSLQSENAITFARITLDGQILAMLIDVRMNDRVYGFKTAFNESFADHSPGMLIEYENLKSLHSEQCLLFDACCGPDNGLLNSLYTDRLSFQDFVIGLTPSMSPFVSRVMPTMQSIAMNLRKR